MLKQNCKTFYLAQSITFCFNSLSQIRNPATTTVLIGKLVHRLNFVPHPSNKNTRAQHDPRVHMPQAKKTKSLIETRAQEKIKDSKISVRLDKCQYT